MRSVWVILTCFWIMDIYRRKNTLNFVLAPQMTNVSLHEWCLWFPLTPPGRIWPTWGEVQDMAPPASNQNCLREILVHIMMRLRIKNWRNYRSNIEWTQSQKTNRAVFQLHWANMILCMKFTKNKIRPCWSSHWIQITTTLCMRLCHSWRRS